VSGAVGVALLGVGRWGRKLARVLEARGELVLGWTRSEGTNAAYFRQHHPRARHTTDLVRAIEDPEAGAVVIATPPATHAALAEAGLRAGKQVFVEKPMCTDAQSARGLVALAEGRGRVLFVGHVFLHHPVFERLRAEIGARPIEYVGTSWRKLGTFETGLLWNLACHEVSLALALFGSAPSEVTTVHRRGLITACDQLILRLGFDQGGQCLIDIDRCAPAAHKAVTVALADGDVLVWENQTLGRIHRNGTTARLFEAAEDALDREVGAFLAACRGEATPISDSRHGAAVVEVLSPLAVGEEAR
jgi:predicted dehydrogenase